MKSRFCVTLALILVLGGCKKIFYSNGDFSSVPKVDSHIHIRASDGNFENLAAEDNFILISLNVDHGDSSDLRVQQDFASASAARYPGRVFFGASFYFDTTGWRSEGWTKNVISKLEKDLSPQGAVTLKIWKNIGMTLRDRQGNFIMADDQDLKAIYNFMKSRNLPVTGHLGEPRNCWLPLEKMTVSSDSGYFARNPQYHMFLHPDYPSYEAQIKARDNILAENPDLVFIGCHLGSLEWNVDSLAVRLDRYQNFAVDMSARICHLQYQSKDERDKVRDFCIKYQDRLLYGTDNGYSGSNPEGFKKDMHETWLDDWRFFVSDDEMTSDKFRGNFHGLKLPKEVVDKIYFRNAVSYYKLKT